MDIITRQALKDGAEGQLRKQYIAEIKAEEEDDRIVSFIVSTGIKDRDGDIIKPAGWMLDNYRKNPVVLYGHDRTGFPVGKALKMNKKINLNGDVLFTERDINPQGYMTYRLVKGGFLNAVSAGFRSIEHRFREDGIDFDKAELLEFSVVPVPANPEALVMAKGAGIDITPMYAWAESILDYADDMIVLKLAGCDRAIIEAARKAADPKQRLSVLVKGFVPVDIKPVPDLSKVDKLISDFEDSVKRATARIDEVAKEYEEMHCNCGCQELTPAGDAEKGDNPDVTVDLVASVIKRLASKAGKES